MGKRQNGEGTIYQRSNGLWVAEITLGYDDNGKRIRKTVSSMNLDKLKKRLNDMRYMNDRNIVAAPTEYTVASWLDFWLETYKKPSVKSATYDMYYNAVNTYLKNRLGNYKLDNVTTIIVQNMINEVSKCGVRSKKELSYSSLRILYLTLSQAYKQAIRLGIVYFNPCKDTVLPKKKARPVVAFTVDEQSKCTKFCMDDNNTYKNLFVFAFNTGMRMGELLALTWRDYDENKKSVIINKNLSVVHDYSDSGKKQKIIIDSTKTQDGMREIPLSNQAIEIIERQKKKSKNKSLFVFCSEVGTPLQKRNIYRSLKNMLEKIEITSPVTFHSFRHSFATRLLEKGADIKTVSTLLGHKSIQITLDIYSHVSTNLKEQTIALLN